MIASKKRKEKKNLVPPALKEEEEEEEEEGEEGEEEKPLANNYVNFQASCGCFINNRMQKNPSSNVCAWSNLCFSERMYGWLNYYQ